MHAIKIFLFSLVIASYGIALGLPVVDVGSIANSAAIIVNQVEQMTRTKARIESQINSAIRFSKKMKGYKFSSIQDILHDIRSFQYRARSIGYTYKSIVRQFESIYGRQGDFSKKHDAWEKQSENSVKDAMEAQGLIERSDGQMKDLDRAMAAKGKAETNEETLQAIGEINAIQTKQLNDLKHIIATDARARHSVIMERRAKEQAQKQYDANLLKDFNVHKKSRPLAYFPSLGSTAPQVSR